LRKAPAQGKKKTRWSRGKREETRTLHISFSYGIEPSGGEAQRTRQVRGKLCRRDAHSWERGKRTCLPTSARNGKGGRKEEPHYPKRGGKGNGAEGKKRGKRSARISEEGKRTEGIRNKKKKTAHSILTERGHRAHRITGKESPSLVDFARGERERAYS